MFYIYIHVAGFLAGIPFIKFIENHECKGNSIFLSLAQDLNAQNLTGTILYSKFFLRSCCRQIRSEAIL